ncbi:Clavaminate synthase-like protein [Irpex rosettiformis]|uniref:Clavaminate synthase-like protein n=1 Tax=Irpex rosettiformis TaxID=378272 RepID=A0ACB8TX64_9APHY|nr:Clavaminate synthase-like protein [Irpex rosettiformis]
MFAHKRGISTENWRRVYTDACILRSLADILNMEHNELLHQSMSDVCIARLDRAIIIAGPCGCGRLDLILELIRGIQLHTSWTKKLNTSRSSLSSGDSLSKAIALPRTFAKPIPRLDLGVSPSLSAFASTYFMEPFILPGYVLDWPAMQEHPWRSIEYLEKIAGPGRIVPVEVGSDYRTDDWTQTLMSWESFLASLSVLYGGSEKEQVPKPVLYLAQHNLFTQFPALRNDIIVPDYVYAAPDAPENYPEYHPPANDEQLVTNVWLGPAGAVSPAHTDPFFNFYAQVVGKKTVWLSSPETSSYMYPYSNGNRNTDESPADPLSSHSNPAANNVEPLMSNTSRVDVFAPDDTKYPLFSRHVMPGAMCATLEPGDLLYFPPGWWHAMRSEETSFSVSMWF